MRQCLWLVNYGLSMICIHHFYNIQVDLLKQKKELEKRVVEMTDGELIQPLIVEDQQTVEVLNGM